MSKFEEIIQSKALSSAITHDIDVETTSTLNHDHVGAQVYRVANGVKLNLEIIDRATPNLHLIVLLQEESQLAVRVNCNSRVQIGKFLLESYLVGNKSSSTITGCITTNESMDMHCTIIHHHFGKHTTGDIRLGAIVRDASTFTGRGRIVIDKGASATESLLTERALLLGEQATAVVYPDLEIDTNEVTASHSATVHNLDLESLYYLQSRGIDEIRSTDILVKAFRSEFL